MRVHSRQCVAVLSAVMLVCGMTSIHPFMDACNISSITASAASDKTDFQFDASTGIIIKYIGTDAETVEIPVTIGDVLVTRIGKKAFSDCVSAPPALCGVALMVRLLSI